MVGCTVLEESFEGYLSSRRVIDLCASRLLGIGSPLAEDNEVWKRCSMLAAEVVADCVRSMELNWITIDKRAAARATEFGALLVERDLNVLEAVRAGAILCEVVADVLGESGGNSGRRQWIALRTAQRSIALRVEAFSASYAALLAARDQQCRQEEREILSRELHDYVGANINLAQRHLELHRLYRDRGHPSAELEVLAAEQVIQDVLQGTSQLLHDLRARPPVNVLGSALWPPAKAALPDAEVREVHLARNESSLSDLERHEIYLICHEGLRNVFAHAQASRISVRVDIDADQVQAVIEDDGLGFDAGANQEPGHYGLTSMKARTELLGGVFKLSSFPGGGTRACVRIPIHGLEWSL